MLNLRFNFHRVTVLLSVVSYLEKGLTPKIGMLYFIILNKRSFFNLFCFGLSSSQLRTQKLLSFPITAWTLLEHSLRRASSTDKASVFLRYGLQNN